MTGLGEFGDLKDPAAVRAALAKIKTWSKTQNAGGITFKETADFPFKNVQEAIEGVGAAAYILSALLDVDGSGSGLDADTVDGLHAAAGTYTPTATIVANLDAVTVFSTAYLRVGSAVVVYGSINVDATTAGFTTEVDLSLPIASNFTSIVQAGGVAIGAFLQAAAQIDADATNDRVRVRWVPGVTTTTNISFILAYQVL